ncbi:MAG: PAS domain S-box protein [Prolixibacteraceae bacterium]|nr:PAS domain S-box protein [Prolixibacteraceae bacterium]
MDYSIKTKEELVAELEDLKKNYNALLTTLIPAGDDQHLIRSELSESSQRWKYAIENTTDGLWDWDMRTGKVFYSAQWKAMLGFEESEIGDSLDEWSKRVFPDDLPEIMREVNKHLNGETESFSGEYRIICKDGAVKWILDEGKIVSFDKDGKPARFIGTHKDITLRKKIEFDLKERMKELNCLNSISEIMSNPQLSIDDACQSIVQIIPASWQFPDFAQASISIQDKTYNTGKFKDCLNCMVREITTNEHVWGKITVCYPEENLPFHHQLFLPEESTLLYSIAERLGNFISKAQIQKHLEESELKYRSLIERINDVIYEIDDKGIIKYISPSIEKIIGYTQQEIIGQSFIKFVGVNSEYLSERLIQLSKTNELRNEYKLTGKSGNECWIRLSTKAIFDNERFVGGTGTLIDITETKRIEQALLKSESLYRSILSASPDFITITDLEGKILISSPNILQKFGLPNNESLINHSVLEFIHPDYRQKALDNMRLLLNDIRTGATEYKALKADGTTFDIEVNADFIYNKEGNKTNIVYVSRDITTRKIAEEKLLQSEETYRHLVETINDVIYEIDPAGIIKFASPSVVNILGYTVEEVLGRNIFEFIYPEDVEEIKVSLGNLKMKDYSFMEYRYVRKDGSINWVRSSTTAVIKDGVIVGGTGTLTDITKRKFTEEKLRKSEESFRNMVENINDVVYEVSANGNVNYVSPSIEKLLGYKSEELIGKNFFSFMHEDDRPLILERLATLDKREYSFLEYRYYSKTGKICWVRSSTNAIIENGEIVGGRGVLIDITERKKSEEALRFSEERLQNLINSQTNLVLWTDLEGKNIYWNRKFEEEYGWLYTNSGIDGASALTSICEYHHQRTYETVEKCIANPHQIIKVELDKQAKDGGVRTTLWEFKCLANINNAPYAIQCMGIDITERKEVERQLQESEQKYKALFYDSPLGYLIIQDGKFIECNKASEAIIGGDRSYIIGKTPDEISPIYQPNGKKSSLYAKELISKAFSEGSNTFEWIHKRADNSEFLARIDLSVIEYQGKQVLFVSWLDITAQRLAEEKLKESEQRFRMVFENVFDGISIFEEDPDPAKRKLVDCNERYAAMAGRSRKELLKIGTTYSFSQNLDEGATEARMKGISEKQAYQGSFKWIRPDGKDNIIEYIAQPINLGGKTYSIGIDRDITEFKQKEDQLRKLSQAVEQSPVSIVITDLDGNIEYANTKACATTGYSLEELKGQNPRVLKSGETSHNEYQDLWDSITHGNIWKGTFHNKRKNGELYWESSQITPITDSKGQIINFLALKEDITERKKMEEELTRSEERFRQITEQSQTVIWEIDAKGMYTYVSPIAQTVWGYEPHELIGQKYFYDLHPYEGRNEFKREVLASFAQKEIFRDITNQVLTKTNQLIWVSTNAVPILDNQNNLLGYRGADNDITARKQAEGALKRSEELLNYAQEIAHMGNWDLDLTTNEMTWSKNYYRLLGLDPEQDVPRDHFMKMVHPEDVHLLDEKLEEMIQTKGQVSLDMRLILSDGTIKWVQNNVVPRFSYNIMVGMSGVNIDITEKKLFEEKISYQHDRLNAIISAIPDLIFINDADGNYLEFFVSDNEKLLLDPHKIVGTNIRDIFDQKMSSSFLSKINKVLTKRVHEVVEYTVSLPNSQNASFEARIVPLSSDRVLILSRDITEKTAKDIQIKRLSLAIEQSPVSIVITDLDANIEYVNPSFETTTGYSAEEVIGKNANILKSGNTDPKMYTELWETIKNGNQWSGEWLNKKKNGQLFWEYISITPIYDDFGKIINYLAVKQDISDRKQTEKEILELNTSLEEKIKKRTAELAETNSNLIQQIEVRKQAEQALAKSEKGYRMVVENVAEVIFQTDADGFWIFLNKSWETITGFTVNESLGQLFVNYVHPEDRARNWELFEPLIQRKKDYCRHEIRYLTKDGGYRWIEVFAKLGLDEEDQIIGTYGTLQDITERKKAEELVVVQKERLESIIEGSSIGTWEWNIQTGETIFNDRWADLIGYSLEELSPTTIETWIQFAHPEDLPLSENLLKKHFLGETELYQCEARMRHKDGSWIWVFDSGKVISWTDDGKPLWMFGSHHDITERKRAEIFENELLKLSPKLTGIALSEIDSAINMALSRIGNVLNADRSYIFEFHSDFMFMDNTHEWCNEKIEPQIQELQNVPLNIFPEWMNVMKRHETIIIESVKDLPENWKAEKEILEPQGIQSLVVIPMMVENKLIGFVGLDSVKTRRTYASTEINILKVWSSMLSSLINNKRTGSLLEQTRQNYETFFNTIDDFLWVLDQNGNIIHTNNTVNKRLEYSENELLNKSVLMTHPEGRREEAGRIVGEMLSGTAEFCPVPVVTKSGKPIPVETRVKHGFWNGNPAIFGVSKDISKIQLSEQKFSSAFHSNSAVMTITRFADLQFMDVNSAFISTFGYTREDILGETLVSLGIIKEKGAENEIKKAIDTGIPVRELEVQTFSKSGDLHILLLSAEEIFIGMERCILSVGVDITARKRAEEQLQWNKSLLEMMSNSSPLGFLVVDNRTDEILYFNKRFCQIWGIENLEEQMQRGELKNNDIIPYCIPMLLDVPAFAESCKPLQDENNRIVISDEIPFKNDRTIHRYSTQIRGIDDKYYGRFYIFEDVTEEKKAQHELMNARNEAEKANMAKSEFLSRMSHELRTPMNSILGFAQLLEMGELNVGQKKGVNHILKSGRHLLDLINEVLDISRIESGRLSLSLEPVLLGSVIPEMIDIIKPQANERQITIEFENLEATHLYVKSDRQRLKQVLLNLLNNAVKYNKQNGKVCVKCELIAEPNGNEQMVRISISDTGKGISEEDLPKLFMPFERIGAEKTSTEGTGLGLSVVKKLMEAMTGQVGVESQLGKGSTFWIELPNIDSQMQVAIKSGKLNLSGGLAANKRGTVLYIEDNASNIELIEQILTNQRSNIRLITTMQGRQAVKLSIEYQPDIILLDLNLPDIHGSKVIKLLLTEERTKHIPVVIISADAMPQQLEKLKKEGARKYLTKPLDITEFLKVIDEYITN